MSSSGSAGPLSLEPRPSRLLLAAILLSHAAALLVLPLLSVPPWLSAAAALALDLSFFHQLALHHWRILKTSIRRAVWEADGLWRLWDGAGGELQGRVLGSSVVLPGLILLHLACTDGRRRQWVLPADSLDASTRRRLRVRLRTSTYERPGPV